MRVVLDKLKSVLQNEKVNEAVDGVQAKFVKNSQVNRGIDAVQNTLAGRKSVDTQDESAVETERIDER